MQNLLQNNRLYNYPDKNKIIMVKTKRQKLEDALDLARRIEAYTNLRLARERYSKATGDEEKISARENYEKAIKNYFISDRLPDAIERHLSFAKEEHKEHIQFLFEPANQ